jgi:RimJ/RimL family protein N-acetyltransferase
MQAHEFVDYHRPALETDEPRHNVMLWILGRVADGGLDFRSWTLGAPGQCAVQTPPHPIILGDLDEAQCRRLAGQTADLDYPAVVGPDLTATWFVSHALRTGLRFEAPIPQQIHALRGPPAYPGAPGKAFMVDNDHASLFADWMMAFSREATPHDPPLDRAQVMQAAGEGRYMFWVVDDEPVAMAGIVRRTRHAAAIAGVYTPPALRGRGYGGSVTAAVAELAFAQGKTVACLYADLRNPSANRCYARIGFEPVCSSWHFPRAPREQPSARQTSR